MYYRFALVLITGQITSDGRDADSPEDAWERLRRRLNMACVKAAYVTTDESATIRDIDGRWRKITL